MGVLRIFVLAFALAGALALPARAACKGRDLIAEMPAADLANLRAAAQAAPFAQGNLWRARRGADEIVIVGTLHLADPRHAAALAALAPDLARPFDLLVEAGPAEETALKAWLADDPSRLVATGGTTLPESLSPQDWATLAEALRARGIPPFMAARLRPWYVATLLALPPCALAAGATDGLDRQLVTLAQERGLSISALEPFDTAFRVLEDLTAEDQIRALRLSLIGLNRAEDLHVTLLNAYFAGENRLNWEFMRAMSIDEAATAGMGSIEADFALVEDRLISARNRAWIPVIEKSLASGDRLLVLAFGALHLPGAEGVLNLLVGQGFSIEGIPVQ